MQLTSTAFGIFVLVVWCGCWIGDAWLKTRLSPMGSGWRTGWLLAACLVFLISWSWEFAVSLLLIGSVNFGFGLLLGRLEPRRAPILWLGIVLNVAALAGFKYANYFLPVLRAALNMGSPAEIGAVEIMAPVGLSFLCVQMISYLVDVQRRQTKPETNWIKFSLYALYFPKLFSGPIERARTFLPKLETPQPLNTQNVARAMALIATGLVRKVILANTLYALLPADLFISPLNYPAQLLAIWLIGYAFFLYNDFAGYTALARGVSLLFGIELSQNFNTPYFAQNFSDFWNRWHISLSAWLRDYIYFPLARALRGFIPDASHKIHIILPPLVTMAVSGLWHGVSWNMLVWGGLHGLYQAAERLLNFNTPKALPGERAGWKQMMATVVTFIFVTLAWIPFRMDLTTARRYFAGLFLPSHWLAPDFYWLSLILTRRLPMEDFSTLYLPDPRLLFVLCLSYLFDRAQAKRKDELFFIHWSPWALAAASAMLVVTLFLLSFTDLAAPFVYQGF